jgi:hypothetical protein
LADVRSSVSFATDFCSEAMLKGWKEDEKNTLSSDEQFAVYLKLYNECFKVRRFRFGLSTCLLT